MRRSWLVLVGAVGCGAVAAVASCGGADSGGGSAFGGGDKGGAGGADLDGAAGGSGDGGLFGDGSPDAIFDGPYADFPSSPVIDDADGGGGSVPSNAPQLFGDADAGASSGGPCLVEPEIGALFPNNWLRPRFHFIAPSGENLFEIRLHAAKETDDLVVYTASTSWTMPLAMWQNLATHVTDQPITVTVRGASWDGTTLTGLSTGTSGDFTIAPVAASGSVVYWTTSGGSTLKGFSIGDESVVAALAPSQVKMQAAGGAQVTCLGCHTSTPDGKYAGFTTQGPWGNAIASIEQATVGDEPSFLGQGAIAALQQPEIGIQTFSKAHWKAGDRIEIAPFGTDTGAELAWFDLEATQAGQGTAYGFLARTGDSRGVGAPTWSHDGVHVTYVSTTSETTGRLGAGDADLYTVEYDNRQGGAATAVKGASDPAYNEYYPAYSADDALLAFDRIASGADMYNQPTAEVYVVPSSGGTAVRLAANDPPACTGKTSPGVTNSWPKWSPEVLTAKGKKYYWLIFSSTRDEKGNPQLYVTGVVDDGGTLKTYASLYLWNQPADENNHTPAWDVFKIPPPAPH
jgi:hypothetical protein